MYIRQLIAGATLALAAAGAFAKVAPLPAYSSHTYDLHIVQSPSAFLINNPVTSTSFKDYITFGVNPTSYADQVFFSQLQLGKLQNIATATLSLWDTTTNTYFGSVSLNEPMFTAAEIFYSGHKYLLQVEGTLAKGAQGGYYGISGMLTPVPEPETWALLGLGMVSLVAARARSRKRSSGRLDIAAA